jgi:hypothetical protein
MSSVQEQLAKRRRDLEKKLIISRLELLKKEIDASVKGFLSEVFSQWRLYKRFYEQIAIIQRFMRSFSYKNKMRNLKKNHREPDSATHTAHQVDWFIRMEQNREAGISLSRDLKNDRLTILSVFLRGFVRTHSTVVNEPAFTQKMREMLSRDEFNYIQNLIGNQSFIEFFESTRITRDDILSGCSTQKSTRKCISDLLWILYYLSSEQLPKSWFPNPESDFARVFEELRTILSQYVQEDEERHCVGPPEQPDYCPEPCSQCGRETIQRSCFNAECMRRRESACASCGNPIEGNNAVEVDGMRLHVDCANHNQHNSHFRNYTECSACGCSSNDMSFVEEFGLLCDRCISANK